MHQAALDARARMDGVIRRARLWPSHASDGLSARQAKVINAWPGFGQEAFPGGINNARFARIAHCSRASATRDLSDLVARGILAPVEGRGGRSAAYCFADRAVWTPPYGPQPTPLRRRKA